MHLKFGYFVLYTPIYRLTERKKNVSMYKHAYPERWVKNSVCARAPRVRQGGCQIWYARIPR